MTSFVYSRLILLLIFLQVLAPLIHAHQTDIKHQAFYIHLPEFEQIAQSVHSDATYASQVFTAPLHSDTIFTIGAGIKNDQRRFMIDADVALLGLVLNLIFTAIPCQISFFLHLNAAIAANHFDCIAPRAPPVF